MKKNILIIILIAFCQNSNAQNLQNPYFNSDGANGATSWTFNSTPSNATFVGGPGSWVPDGQTYLAFYSGSSYNGIVTQTINSVPNGIYSLTSETMGSNVPGHEMFVNGYGGTEKTVLAPEVVVWTTISITNIIVTNGQITVGFRTGSSPGGSFRNFTKAVFTLTGTLPVSLTSYSISVRNNLQVQLDWKTISEQNNDYFTILKSLDGKVFENIGQIKGFSSSNVLRTYSFIDKKPTTGVSYYKLMQYDFNGKETELGVKTTSLNLNDESLTIYPNPASDYIKINAGSNKFTGAVSVKLYDLKGKLLIDKVFDAVFNDIQLPISNVTSGTYFIIVNNNNYTATRKIAVTN
jgi:hypothetical protein